MAPSSEGPLGRFRAAWGAVLLAEVTGAVRAATQREVRAPLEQAIQDRLGQVAIMQDIGRAFNAKLEDKSAWTRGLFVSESGFSPDGLIAFGRGKRVICMDGLDLHDMLDKCLSLVEVLSKKARHLAETGEAFVRVRDLK